MMSCLLMNAQSSWTVTVGFALERNINLVSQNSEQTPCKASHMGGISKRGATNVIMFSGIMNAEWLKTVLEVGLLPFIRDYFPDGHRLYHENDPKHASCLIEDFFEEKKVN